MKVTMLVKATRDSEAGVIPDEKPTTAKMKYNDLRQQAEKARNS